MSDLTIARRYARALFDLARERGLLTTVQDDLEQVILEVRASDALKKFFTDQLVPAAKKKAVLRKVFAQTLAGETLNFLMLVLDKRREGFLEEMHQQFLVLVNEAQNVMEAEVRSAIPLSAGEMQALTARLVEVSGKKARIANRVVPGLLGGLVLKIGDRVYDGSISHRLERLREKLRQADFRETGVRQST